MAFQLTIYKMLPHKSAHLNIYLLTLCYFKFFNLQFVINSNHYKRYFRLQTKNTMVLLS